jgi:hypothetical protein
VLGARSLGFLFVLALAARLAAVGYVGFSTVRFPDARNYLFAAKEIVRTGHYPLRTDPLMFFRPPGYPAFLVLATLGHPDRIAWAKAANCLAGALAAVVLASISAHVFRRRRVAILTGLAAAIHPAFVLLSTDIQTEPLFLLLLLGSGLLLLVAVDRPSSNLALAAGALLAAAALTRSSALPLAIFLLAPFLDRRYPLRARAHIVLSGVFGFVLALAPWTLRNALVYRELLLVNDGAGIVFYAGNSDRMLDFYEAKNPAELQAWARETNREMDRQIASFPETVRLSPARLSRELVRKALQDRVREPRETLRLYSRKIWDWLRPYPHPLYWPRGVVWLTASYYCLLFVFAGVGIARARRRGVVRFSIAFLCASMAVHVLLLVAWRYRVPYWDPLLLLYGVFGAGGTLLERWKS